MEIKQLKLFMTICEDMSYQTAAEKLSADKKVIAEEISTLEQTLNCTLFECLNDQLYLTPKGQIMKLLGASLIEDYNQLISAVKEQQHENIRVGVTESLCTGGFPEFISGFLSDSPDTKIIYIFNSNSEIITLLQGKKIDIAFVEETEEKYKNLKIFRFNHNQSISSLPDATGQLMNLPGNEVFFQQGQMMIHKDKKINADLRSLIINTLSICGENRSVHKKK
jgi:DNA-binding transcriptional LysR family regulator